MATLTERLQWIVSADATSAITGFKAVGDTADRELGKAESRMKSVSSGLTKFGAGAVASAGVLGGALVKAAGSFENLALSAGKFSATAGTSVEQSSRLIEITKDLGVSSDVLEKSFNFMNKTLGKTPELFDKYGVSVKLAKDGSEDVLGTFENVVTRLNAIPNASARAAAANALLGKGWTGLSELIGEGSDKITKSLADVSDAKVVDPAELQTAKDYRASLDSLRDGFEDLVNSIGKGAAPVIGQFASALGGAAASIAKVNTISSGAAGRILAIGTVALGAAGAISLVAGQALKMSERFTDAEGALNGFGKAAQGVGIALAGVAAAEVAFSISDAVRGVHNLNNELNTYIAATAPKASLTAGQVVASFQNLANAATQNASSQEAAFDVIGGVLKGNLDSAQLYNKGAVKAFEDVKDQSLDAADQVVTSLELLAKSAAGGNQEALDFMRSYGLTTEQIAGFRKEVTDAKGAQDRLNTAVDTGTDVDAGAQDAADKLTQAWAGYASKLHDAANATSLADANEKNFQTSLEAGATSASGSIRANLNLDGSYAKLKQSIKDNGKTIDEHTEKGRNNISAILDVGDAIRNNLLQQLKDSGESYTQVTSAADEYRGQLEAQLKQAGLTDAQVQDYIHTLGLTPEQVETAIKLTGQANAKSILDTLNVQLDDVPDEKKTEYVNDFAAGDYQAALTLIQGYINQLNQIPTSKTTQLITSAPTMHASADGRFVPGGSNLLTTVGETPGTAGDEVILPLGDPAQMREILSVGGAASRVAAVLGTPGFGGTYNASQVTVNTTPVVAAAATAVVAAAPSAADVTAEQDRIQAAMYKTGRISLQAYRDYAQGRLATAQDLSDDYVTQYDLIQSLNDQEAQSEQDKADAVKQASDDQIAAQDDLEKNMYDLGAITTQQYKDYLTTRLGTFQEYSDGYVAVYKQLKDLSDQDVADTLANTKALYDQAQASKAASDAEVARANAYNDVLVSGAAGGRIQADRHSTAADRDAAVQDLTDKESSLADDTYKTVLAKATEAKLDVGTVEWDRFVRAALADYLQQYGDLPITSAILQSDMGGIPALATGGTVKATAGGVLVRVAEGGQDEHIIRDDRLQSLTAMVMSISSQPRSITNIYTHQGMDASAIISSSKRYDRRNGTTSGRRDVRVGVGS